MKFWMMPNLSYQLPKLYIRCKKDAQAILDTDPAADCIQEIINSYRFFLRIEVYRIANAIASRTTCLVHEFSPDMRAKPESHSQALQ
jgi:serine O-acetyltransferase